MAATALLISDLEEMVALWDADGEARLTLTEGEGAAGLATIITGPGSLSYGELAGERMQLGVMLHDPEEEHDCFADNTHNSHYFNQVGMQAVYNGHYVGVDGRIVSGPSLADIVAHDAPDLAEDVSGLMAATDGAMDVMKAVAEGGMAYDQMLGESNPVGNQVLQDVIDALVGQAGGFEQVVAALDLDVSGFEGSDSLDDPDAVFQ